MNVIYGNEYYEVYLVEDDENTPYHLVNREHGVVEAKESNKPQILVYAEQFNHMLKSEFHKKIAPSVELEEPEFDFQPVPPTTQKH